MRDDDNNSGVPRLLKNPPRSTHKRVWTDLLAFRASASCLVRPMVDTTPRLRLSCARECDSAMARHTRPKSRSDSWQPRTDSSRTLFSFRLSHMSLISAPDSASPDIWIELGSISVVSSSINGHYGSWRSDPRRLIRCTGLGISRKVWCCCCCLLQRVVRLPPDMLEDPQGCEPKMMMLVLSGTMGTL